MAELYGSCWVVLRQELNKGIVAAVNHVASHGAPEEMAELRPKALLEDGWLELHLREPCKCIMKPGPRVVVHISQQRCS